MTRMGVSKNLFAPHSRHWRNSRPRPCFSSPGVVLPAIKVVIGEALLDELDALIEHATAPRKVHGVDADLLGVPGVVAFVELMAATEFRADGIPDQLDQLDSLLGGRSSTAVVAIDKRAQPGVGQIFAPPRGRQRRAGERVFQD